MQFEMHLKNQKKGKHQEKTLKSTPPPHTHRGKPQFTNRSTDLCHIGISKIVKFFILMVFLNKKMTFKHKHCL